MDTRTTVQEIPKLVKWVNYDELKKSGQTLETTDPVIVSQSQWTQSNYKNNSARNIEIGKWELLKKEWSNISNNWPSDRVSKSMVDTV